MMSLLNSIPDILKGISMKDVIFLAAFLLIFYVIMTGKSLVSRVLQLIILVYAGNTFHKYSSAGDYKRAVIESFLIIFIFFAPVVIKFTFNFLKTIYNFILAVLETSRN